MSAHSSTCSPHHCYYQTSMKESPEHGNLERKLNIVNGFLFSLCRQARPLAIQSAGLHHDQAVHYQIQ